VILDMNLKRKKPKNSDVSGASHQQMTLGEESSEYFCFLSAAGAARALGRGLGSFYLLSMVSVERTFFFPGYPTISVALVACYLFSLAGNSCRHTVVG